MRSMWSDELPALVGALAQAEGSRRTDLPWGAVLVGFGLLLVVLLAMLVARSSRRKGTESPSVDRSATLLAAQVLADAQWLHDHLSLAVLAGPGPEAQQRWIAERPRVEALSKTAYHVAVDAPEEVADVWIRVATAATSLASSLDVACARRAVDDHDPAAVADEMASVEAQRRGLLALVEQGRSVLTHRHVREAPPGG